MKTVILHDDNCPKGTNGLRAYWEARDALASLPPEARNTEEDKAAIAVAEFQLEQIQVCKCGAEPAQSTAQAEEPRSKP